VRPDSFIEISNFYTLTVYEKGAEVVRMLHTLLGPERFRAGSDLYFARHDGQAVTCDDFVAAMEDASGLDLTQFKRWYSQAGTPELSVRDEYDGEARRYTLHVRQHLPPTPGQEQKLPQVIPLAMGLLGEAGHLRLQLAGEAPDAESEDNTHRVLLVREAQQSFVFEDVPEQPVPSLLRGFSAPVRLDYPWRRADLCALMSRDADGFVRWDAAQQLMGAVLGDVQAALAAGDTPRLDPLLTEACRSLLADSTLEPAMAAHMLSLPAENTLIELAAHAGGADVDAIVGAREWARRELARQLQPELARMHQACSHSEAYCANGEQIGRRALRNLCLGYLGLEGGAGVELARTQLAAADNLTDRLAALRVLAEEAPADEAGAVLAAFYERWQHENLVVNQWLQLQAQCRRGDAVARVRALMAHPSFELGNPNRVRALIGAFAGGNARHFHRDDGAGYALLADVVCELNRRNPQIASRLVTPLSKWRQFPLRSALMRAQLERLAALELSRDVYEVVSKSLA
jgi:aminopeptidase N